MSENENFGKLSGGVPPGARWSEVLKGPYILTIPDLFILLKPQSQCTDLYLLLKPQSQLGYLGYISSSIHPIQLTPTAKNIKFQCASKRKTSESFFFP